MVLKYFSFDVFSSDKAGNPITEFFVVDPTLTIANFLKRRREEDSQEGRYEEDTAFDFVYQEDVESGERLEALAPNDLLKGLPKEWGDALMKVAEEIANEIHLKREQENK